MNIKIFVDTKVTAGIRCDLPAGSNPRDLWFLDTYGPVSGLTGRLGVVDLYDRQGNLIATKRMTAADNISTRNIGGLRYLVDLMPLNNRFAAAHASWVTGERGVLMLDDLLPQNAGKTAKVSFEMPAGWRVLTTEAETAPNVFTVANVEKAVFYAGSNIREHRVGTAGHRQSISLTGDWLFTDAEAAATAGSIMAEYERQIGKLGAGPSRVWISKFPHSIRAGEWDGDTRGRSVTIISSDMGFKSQSLQRLHEQLRHEVFHLWIPNGVNLKGNYDWFYEGFTLYQSLRTGVAVNQIRFEDMLDTLSRAFDIDSTQTQRASLTDASKSRWTGANTQVYARGMLVAFLCDLALLERSRGKQSVSNLLREIFEKHRPPAAEQDGNTAVLAHLRTYRELAPIIDRNIAGAASIDWNALLRAAGLEAESRDQLTRLKVTAKPTGRQKEILDKLGYNNWRKLSSGIK